MKNFFKNINDSGIPIPILDATIPISSYCSIDLSVSNPELGDIKVSNPRECQSYIDLVLQRNDAKVAYGGYLERRKLYEEADLFSGQSQRNIHLGMDFWCAAGTKVLAPFAGKVHSLKNNAARGNYGPTILLEHQYQDHVFYSLYGHLSLESLKELNVGKKFESGEPFATLGETEINVNYAPHLHFQLIIDLENYSGDYPGVCNQKDLDFYIQNCPNPNFLLQL